MTVVQYTQPASPVQQVQIVPPAPLPISWTTPGQFAGRRGEDEVQRQAESYGASVVRTAFEDWFLDCLDDLTMAGNLRHTGKHIPDLIITHRGLNLQLATYVRGQKEHRTGQLAWNFTADLDELAAMKSWTALTRMPSIMAFISTTQSVHIATPEQVQIHGLHGQWGYTIVNVLDAGFQPLGNMLTYGMAVQPQLPQAA